MKVKDYMSDQVVTANLRDGLRQTFYRMIEREVRHMPVLNGDEQVVGIISDRDLRRPDWVDAEENVAHYYLLDNAARVEDAMSRNPITVRPEDDLRVAVEIFTNRRYGALPVVDANNKAVGVISAFDALRAFSEQLRG